jgi:hypothetical protein
MKGKVLHREKSGEAMNSKSVKEMLVGRGVCGISISEEPDVYNANDSYFARVSQSRSWEGSVSV